MAGGSSGRRKAGKKTWRPGHQGIVVWGDSGGWQGVEMDGGGGELDLHSMTSN